VRTAAVDVARTTSAREALIAAARRAPQGELPPLLRSGGIMTAADEAAKTAGARLENARTILRRETAAQAGAIAEREARPGLLNRAAGATAESAGRATNAVGRGLQRLATVPDAIANRVAQGADETVRGTIAEGTRNVLSGLGVLPAAAGTTGLGISNVGRNIEAFGRVLGQAEGQLPFFKTLARETDGLTSWGASLVDQSGLARVVVPAARTVGDVARGLPTNAALALIQSGGDPDKAAEALASGLVFGMAGSGVGQWHRYGNPEAFKRQQLGDVNRYRQTLPTEEARTFYGRLPGAERAALATMQLAHPDLKIKYVSQGKGRPSMYYMAEDGPVAVINMDTRDPISAVVAHEVGHHIERHGLGPQIERVLFGDPLLKQPGLFTQLDAQGHPVLAPDGTYAKTSEWAGLREAYNERVRALAEMTGEYVPDRNDSQIAKEFFSEHAADYLTGSNQAKLRRDLRSDVWSRAVDGLASSGLIGGKPMLKQIMGKMGMPIADGSERIVGSGLFPSGLRTSREFEELIRKYHQEVARGRGPGLIDEPAGTRYTAEEVAKHPEVLDKLFDGTDDVARDTRGRVIRNKDGSPKFTTPKEQKAQRAALAADLSAALEKSPPPGARLETVTEGGKPQEGWVVPGIPDKILNDLQASGKYNPTQLEHLRSISKAIEEGKGKSALFFYQPATRGGAQSGKYKSLAGDFRTETPYQIFVSKQGNVVVRMMSREKLMANAQNFVAKGRGGLWNNRLPELVKDVDTYLGNHAAGRPGAEGLGIEKRDQLNALFEIDTNANRAANPLMEEGARKKGIIRSRRIDRINKLTPVEEYFPTNYNSLNRNLRPEAVLGGK
jgi:hypothetical protein